MADNSPTAVSRVSIRAVLVQSEKKYSIELDGVEMARKIDLARARQVAQQLADVMKSPGEIRVYELGMAAHVA